MEAVRARQAAATLVDGLFECSHYGRPSEPAAEQDHDHGEKGSSPR